MAINEKLTSFLVDKKLMDEFKITGIRYKMSIKNLAERAMFLFVTDNDFRIKILNTLSLEIKKQFFILNLIKEIIDNVTRNN